MTFENLHLMRPEWLWALLPCGLLIAALWRSRSRVGSWSNIIAPELLKHLVGEQATTRARNHLPWILCAWTIAVIALAGPSTHKIPQPVHQREDALVIVLDLSYSMKAADLAPSRLDRARQKIIDLLQRRDEGQTGLIAFAGDAHVVTPLTDDNPTIINLLPALSPDMMPVPGSDALGAIEQAIALLRSGGVNGGRILLLTDAVSSTQSPGIASAVLDAGAELVVMGIGTDNGAPLPLPNGGFLKDQQGAIVIPTLDSAALAILARDAGGRYLPMRIGNSDLKALAHSEALPGQERLTASDRRADSWEDQGYVLVLLLLPFTVLLFRRGLLLTLLPLLLLADPNSAHAQVWDDLWLTPDQQGKRAMDQGNTDQAQQLFENPAWAGTAAYRNGDYKTAAEDFSRSESADDLYNRGNALARAGKLDEAIESYRKSLSLKPEQSDAQSNLELVEKLKEQQEQEQEQQDQQPDDGEQQNQDQDSDQDQSPQDQQQDGDSQQDDGSQQDDASQQEQQQDRQEQQAKDPQSQAEQEQQPAEPADKSAQREEESSAEQAPQPAQAQSSPEQAEKDQAMEQWLRRVPDDPSGLLREKFRYESRQRQQQGNERNNESYW